MAKYYWLRLHRDFFKRHDTRIIKGMENGKDYLLFYLQLLCESVDHEGHLRFSDTIPYNPEMLATITDTNVDIVRSAVRLFTELGMMEQYDDGTFHMMQAEKMVGSVTDWAEKKRAYRAKQVEDKRGHVRQEREIELEIEEEGTRYKNLVKKYGKAAVTDMLETVDNYCASKGKKYKDHVATAANWLKRDGVASLPGYGMKSAPKLPTCACGGKLKEYEPGSAMCENRDSEWRLTDGEWEETG